MIKKVINMVIKILTLPIKRTSILGQKKYGEMMFYKPVSKSILGSRKYSNGGK